MHEWKLAEATHLTSITNRLPSPPPYILPAAAALEGLMCTPTIP